MSAPAICFATLCALLGAAAADASSVFVYDTTVGLNLDYEGDLNEGTLSLTCIPGANYRAQIIGGDVGLGFFGQGDALFSASAELDAFFDEKAPGHSAGDWASFTGTGQAPYDIFLSDEWGNTITAQITTLELLDTTDASYLPGIQGQALLSDVAISGTTFQGVDLPSHLDEGTLYLYAEQGEWSTLGELLETSGSAPVYTLELRLVPAPGTLLLTGLAGIVAVARRR
ncbi:MAG: PEP-CTERM sorting domain-containing protein [Phycisphaerales bacterium]|nr:PEP-CTERM sorting domain-containing protein [Phycisphaerales bacterium]